MSKNINQKSSGEPQITIEEEDLCTYWLTKIWPKSEVDFEEFKELMKKKGVKIVNTREFIAF